MKKLVSILLIGLMLISTLTGCGANELGYLNLAKEISSLTQYGFNNKTSIVLSKDLVGEEYGIDFEINGEANVDNLNDLYGTMDFTFKINDVGVNPINIKFADNKVYISKNAVIEMIKYEKMFNGTEEYGKIVEELYDNDLKNIDYIVYNNQAFIYGFEQGLSESFLELPEEEISYLEMYDYAHDYLTKAFKGFDTKLIKKINNGYSFELSAESALEFVKSLVVYLSENKEVVFDETINYLENIYPLIVEEEFSEEEKAAALAELKMSRQDFYDFIDEALLYLEESEALKLYSPMLDGSIIKMQIVKEKDAYKEVIDAEIIYENVSMGKVISATTMTPKDVEKVSVTGNTITLAEMEKYYKAAENKINPVQKVEIQWYADSFSAEAIRHRLNGNHDLDFQPYTIIEGRIYLPLRYIGESFGEEVDWDNENKKAYIVRGEEKIDMTGVLVDSSTMIKIRDFEKLGYKIDYVQYDGKSIAIITK